MLSIVYFDKKNPYWTEDLKVNEAYVNNVISYVHAKLNVGEYLYVSDICKMFGGEIGWDDYNERFTSSKRPSFMTQRFPETSEIKIVMCY